MDPVTAKTLVSLTLVFAISLFSLISFQAFFTQVLADLRNVGVRRVPVRAVRPTRRDA